MKLLCQSSFDKTKTLRMKTFLVLLFSLLAFAYDYVEEVSIADVQLNFNDQDLDKNGYVDASEVVRRAEYYVGPMSEWDKDFEIRFFMDSYDTNGDGKVPFDEFYPRWQQIYKAAMTG